MAEGTWSGGFIRGANGELILSESTEGTWQSGFLRDSSGRLITSGGSTFVNVKSFGAKGDGATNDTTAIKAAYAALGSSKGTVFFPAGTYIFEPKSSGMLETADGTVILGEGRATRLKCKQAPGAAARLFQHNSGKLEVKNITIEGPTTFTAGDELSAIACTETDNMEIYCDNVKFYRIHVGIRTFSGKTHIVKLLNSEVDGGNMGLASGSDKQINVYGILSSAIGTVYVNNSIFKRGGSNETGGTNQAHQIYISHDTPCSIKNSFFYEHIAGRYIQFNGNASGSPPVPQIQLIENCYFGKMQVNNIACHSSEKGPTVYKDCIWDVEQTALEIKGPTLITGNSQLRGGAGFSGQYVSFSTSTSLIITPGVQFKGAPEQYIYSSGNNVDIQVEGAIFEGTCKTHFLITGGTTSKVRLRNLKVVLGASGNFYDVFSGTTELISASNCDFGGTGTRTFFLEAGSTVSLLQLSDNYFHGVGTAVSKGGTITHERSKNNYIYADVET